MASELTLYRHWPSETEIENDCRDFCGRFFSDIVDLADDLRRGDIAAERQSREAD